MGKGEARGIRRTRLGVRSAFLLFALLMLWTAPALAQGCAMCYSTAAASSKEGQQAIDRGVAILLVPPVGFMTLGVGLAFRYGRKRDRDHDAHRISFRAGPSSKADES